ncbi:MAG: AMP-binding protein [Methylacidiphilaceae bacterium]|nr:AMP-binding protein [Candidatus Methylacidiphilaceae bacterium]
MAIEKARNSRLASCVRGIGKILARILLRVTIRGSSEFPSRAIYVANHLSLIDAPILHLFLPIRPVFVVYAGMLRNPFYRWVIGQADHFLVEEDRPFALKGLLDALVRGHSVLIFPEGRMSLTGGLRNIQEGAAFLALHSGAPIVPLILRGTHHFLWGSPAPVVKKLSPKVSITVGRPVRIEVPAGIGRRKARRLAFLRLRELMEAGFFQSTELFPLFESVRRAARLHRFSRLALEDPILGTFSYGRLLALSCLLGRALGQRSEPGERVGILLPTCVASIALVLGLCGRQRVATLLNPATGRAGLLHAVEIASLQTVVTSRRMLAEPTLAGIGEGLSAIPGLSLLFLEDLQKEIRLGDRLLAWFESRVSPARAPEPRLDDPAVVLFTSGSEGPPKGVLLSHRALASNVAQALAVGGTGPGDKIFSALPLFHAFGLTVGALLPLLGGFSGFLCPWALRSRTIPRLCYASDATILLGTNTLLSHWGRYADPCDFVRIRMVIAGAEALRPAVRRFWSEELGLRLLEGYGVTEAAPLVAGNTVGLSKIGTVGRLLPGIEARLISIPGIAEGRELWIRGPNLMTGYLPARVAGADFREGWYATGDLVERDKEGFLRIIGRLRRFAKIAGEMISLDRSEELALDLRPQSTHAALALPSPDRGEQIVLVTTDPSLTLAELRQAAVREGSPLLGLPSRLLRSKAIPLLPNQKVDYVALASQVAASVLDNDRLPGELQKR